MVILTRTTSTPNAPAPAPASALLDAVLRTSVTTDERARVTAAATAAGQSRSAWIRDAILTKLQAT